MDSDLAQIELIAEIDSLLVELRRWAEEAPDWAPARSCQSLVRRLVDRADTLRVRLAAPLVLATLGGTGTGKSALVNALAGQEVTTSGKQRPTTCEPVLICHSRIDPLELGIDPEQVRVVRCDAPVLRDLVILDCPDPDTTEDGDTGATNLSRLRALLPHCDVLLIASTQQKYRSARVLDELGAAAPGARLVFVQTHASTDEDIRADWRKLLSSEYAVGEMFFVDSLSALADAQRGLEPRGEFARLLDFLTRELSSLARNRIRRANFLVLVVETLEVCRKKIDSQIPAIDKLEAAVVESRSALAAKMAAALREELIASRRAWENRLLSELASRWGYSPFALVLRAYSGLGSLIAASALMRVRSPAQLAIWGAVQGAQSLRERSRQRRADTGLHAVAALGWSESRLAEEAIVLDGHARDAGLARHHVTPAETTREANEVAVDFVTRASGQIQTVISQLATRQAGRFSRFLYESVLIVVLVGLLYRLGKNFFYDSWLAFELGFRDRPEPLLGFDALIVAACWLAFISAILIGILTLRLRSGLRTEIDSLVSTWSDPKLAHGLFAPQERQCRAAYRFRDELAKMTQQVATLREDFDLPDSALGHRIA